MYLLNPPQIKNIRLQVSFYVSVWGIFLLVMLLCVWDRRKTQHKPEVCQTEPGLSPSPTPTDVYNVIRSQKDDDLVAGRPHTKNTSFICSSPDTPTGDYDNLGGRDTESGFVTLASTESCFLNFDLNDLSLGRRGTLNDASLGRPGKRDLNDSRVGCIGHREFYDRSLGHRTSESEHYGSSVCGDRGLYDGRRGSDIYDPKMRPGSHTIKADLYQTYITNGKEDTYQTSLGTCGNQKSYQANLDCYRNGLTLDGKGRYFNEQEWMNSENYWSSKQLCVYRSVCVFVDWDERIAKKVHTHG